MFMQLFFTKVHPACHNIVNSIKPGSDSRKTDKHDVDSSKAVCMKFDQDRQKVDPDLEPNL